MKVARGPCVDVLLTAALFIGVAYLHLALIFDRLEWVDWVAYALPSANLVTRATLSLPQLGTQFDFDQYWRFSSPWMALAPAPWFWLLGVGRVSYLLGVFTLDCLNLVLLTLALRRALQLRGFSLPLLLSQVFFGHFFYLAALYNQRYDLFVYPVIAWAFLPKRADQVWPSTWQWLLAGCLPLIHLSLGIAWIVWIVGLAGPALASKRKEPPRSPVPWTGIAGFLMASVAAATWYGRLDAVFAQLLPHLQTHVREGGFQHRWVGWYSDATMTQMIAGRGTTALVALLSLGVLALRCLPDPRNPRLPVRAALAFVIVVCLDALRGFVYLPFYTLGLGPVIFSVCQGLWMRRLACTILAVTAVANLGASFRVQRRPPFLAPIFASTQQPVRPRWVDQKETLDFLMAHTQPGDRILVGPPFVLTAAQIRLPDDRRVTFVVPQPFYLDTFDPEAFRQEVIPNINVYVGAAEFFGKVKVWERGVVERQRPIFTPQRIDTYSFFDLPVFVARKVTDP